MQSIDPNNIISNLETMLLLQMNYLLVITFLFSSFSLLHDPKADDAAVTDITGTWTNDFDHAIIEFQKEGDTYSGILIKPAKGHELDKNGNPRKQEKIIEGLKYQNGVYVGGTIYVNKFNKYMDCDIKPLGEDALKLNVRYGIMKRSVEWKRIK